MARILLALLFIAVTVFAVADWVVRSPTSTPGRINRWLWLAVILLLPLVGPLTWIIVGAVTRAEEQRSQSRGTPIRRADFRPDDNPDAVSDIVDRINRRQRRTKMGPESLDPSKRDDGRNKDQDADEDPDAQ